MSNHDFEPKDITGLSAIFQLPEETWLPILSTPCGFSPVYFLQVVENLIKNPNITSSCVFRADIFYDSINDVNINTSIEEEHFSQFTQHMKAEYRPIKTSVPAGYQLQRTFVRQMVPRNPQLDQPLVQTCYLFKEGNEETDVEKTAVLMIPHASNADDVPFYHPAVRALAILHTWNPTIKSGDLSIHYRLFPTTGLETRLQRTALNFLKIIHKHGTGQQAGYTKKVHHDLIVPQAKFQNTYTRLKAKYAKILIGEWVEQTDPTKHVFEDLGIAAFLIELWREIYGVDPVGEVTSTPKEEERRPSVSFPGFVDIGCGNGVLVCVLVQEGYRGWGFDARRRMTWSTFFPDVQKNLKEMLLVPEILQVEQTSDAPPIDNGGGQIPFHNGHFPQGTFIISNHADELTPWTPILAYLSKSPFIAIPCCSHNLAGARCRFNGQSKDTSALTRSGGPVTGSLARPKNGAKQPSAYQGLTAYVTDLAAELEFCVDKEMLRIPSTRNAAIVGRLKDCSDDERESDKIALVGEILRREVGPIETVGAEWVQRAQKIAESKGNCH